METVYKLKHKPTGLYYQTVKGRWGNNKTNLSKSGKIYTTYAYARTAGSICINISDSQLKKIGGSYRSGYNGSNIIDTTPDDWEIEEYTLTKI